MKWLVRGVVALVLLAALVLGVLAWALPRLARSEAARARIQEVVGEVVGREVRYDALEFGLFPPSLHVEAPSIAGAPGGEPLARAERVALRVQLWPLLRRELQVSSLTLEGLALHLVRTEQGLELPGPGGATGAGAAPAVSAPGAEPPVSAPPDAGPAGRTDEGGIAYGIRRIALVDASLVLEDRSASPARTLRVEDADLVASGVAPGAPVWVEGTLARVAREDFVFDGPVALEAELDDFGPVAHGPFRIDASRARVAFGSDFAKPAGAELELSGLLVRDDAGEPGIDDLKLALRNLVARGTLRTAPATRLALRADAFALEGWEEVLPVLGVAPLRGRLAVPELAIVAEPLDVRGRLRLDEVEVTPPGSAPLGLTGDVELLGSALRAQGLALRAAEQPFRVDLSLTRLFGQPRYEVAFETSGADVDRLLASYADAPDRLHGPLDAKGTLRGVLDGSPLAEGLDGELAFDIEKGRIVGASLLEAVLGRLGARLAEAGRRQGRADLERFYNESFDLLDGSVTLKDGRLVTRPVRLRYRDYEAELTGPIQLADLGLDLRGTLTLFEAVDAELARAFGAAEGYAPQRRRIELAAVRGTLGAPKVQLAGNTVAGLASAYAQAAGREQLRRRVEEELGEGSGELVDQGLKVLEGLFGGGQRGKAGPPAKPPAEPPAEPPAAPPAQ